MHDPANSNPSSSTDKNVVGVACAALAANDDETMAQVALIVDGIAFQMTMQATIELGLLDIISAAGPGASLTAAEMAAKLPAKGNPQVAEMVDRILRLLATFKLVSCSVVETTRVYGLTPVSKYFVKDEDGLSMASLLMLHQDKVLLESWFKLKDTVLEGGTAFNNAHGKNLFEYQGVDKRFNEVFNVAMLNHTSIVMKKILESYKGFENINQLIDVGGGLGHNLKIITSKYPKIKGMEHIGVDMFGRIPSAEAIFTKWILHDWDDEYCLRLLKNCHKAIIDNGKVIVVELVVEEEPETTTAAKYVHEKDMIMMAQTPGGKERTKQEFLALAMAAGFAGIRFECYFCNFWVMEFYK